MTSALKRLRLQVGSSRSKQRKKSIPIDINLCTYYIKWSIYRVLLLHFPSSWLFPSRCVCKPFHNVSIFSLRYESAHTFFSHFNFHTGQFNHMLSTLRILLLKASLMSFASTQQVKSTRHIGNSSIMMNWSETSANLVDGSMQQFFIVLLNDSKFTS